LIPAAYPRSARIGGGGRDGFHVDSIEQAVDVPRKAGARFVALMYGRPIAINGGEYVAASQGPGRGGPRAGNSFEGYLFLSQVRRNRWGKKRSSCDPNPLALGSKPAGNGGDAPSRIFFVWRAGV